MMHVYTVVNRGVQWLTSDLQYLVDALRYDGQIKNDVHIFSFSLYELAMVHISRDEVILWGVVYTGTVHVGH